MKVALSIALAFFIVGCSSEAPKEEKVVEEKKVEVVAEKSATEQASDKIGEAKDIMVNHAKEVKDELQAEASDKVEEVKTDITSKMTAATESVKETASEAADTVKDKVAEVESATIDAELLWNKCASCHGGMGERAALGKSAVIRNWSSKQVEHALLGYQDGTYGRTMKAMMTSQVKGLSAAEIKAISKYITD